MNVLNYYSNFFFLGILSLFGTFIFYHFINQEFQRAFFSLLGAFVLYFSYAVYVSLKHPKKSSPQALMEVITIFSLFLFPLVAYGVLLFNSFLLGLILVGLFTLTQLLNFIQNWTRYRFEEKGFPIMLHGLFFPLTYFAVQLFIPNFETAAFIVYYVLTSVLSVSPIHFMNYQENVFHPNSESQVEHAYYSKESDNKSSKNIAQSSAEQQNNTSDENELLNSIPYLNSKNPVKESQDNTVQGEDEYIDEEDENFFNSLNTVK
ncbi:MAG: hypothetical protein ACLFPL_02770 [Candidatus Nanoarchaeia archaeon]